VGPPAPDERHKPGSNKKNRCRHEPHTR
jgi:hypothetical protein